MGRLDNVLLSPWKSLGEDGPASERVAAGGKGINRLGLSFVYCLVRCTTIFFFKAYSLQKLLLPMPAHLAVQEVKSGSVI